MIASARKTEVSPLIGKTVIIRHATETDLAFIKRLGKHDLYTDDLTASQFVVAVEGDRIIGFARLRKTGNVYDIGCIAVEEERKNKGIEASIVKHLIEHAGLKKVYVPNGLVDHLRKLGFAISKKQPREFTTILDTGCNEKTRRGSVLMVYEKK